MSMCVCMWVDAFYIWKWRCELFGEWVVWQYLFVQVNVALCLCVHVNLWAYAWKLACLCAWMFTRFIYLCHCVRWSVSILMWLNECLSISMWGECFCVWISVSEYVYVWKWILLSHLSENATFFILKSSFPSFPYRRKKM